MRLAWVLSDDAELDPNIDTSRLKDIGSLWGGWRTWRAYQTDNVICYDPAKAKELIQANFQSRCNFYIPGTICAELDNPAKVLPYAGSFEIDLEKKEEIIALHLAASQNDILLLLGFNLAAGTGPELQNYYGFFEAAISANPNVQWVLINHKDPLRASLTKLDNLTTDNLGNVFEIFGAGPD